MLTSLFAVRFRLAAVALFLPLMGLLLGSALPAVAQSSEDLPSLSLPGIPPSEQPSSAGSAWTLSGPQPNVIVLPGVSQDAIDRVLSSTVSAPGLAGQDVSNPSVSKPQNQLTSTTCSYRPSADQPNPLGENALVTVTEFSDNTLFHYQPLVDISAAASDERFLILYDTPLDTARRLLVGSRDRYAQFLGLPANHALISQGFGPIDQRLTCGESGR